MNRSTHRTPGRRPHSNPPPEGEGTIKRPCLGRGPTWVMGVIAGIIGREIESGTVKASEAEVLEDPGTREKREKRNKEAGIKCQAQELLRV